MTEQERKQAEEHVKRGKDAERALEQDDANRVTTQAGSLDAFKKLGSAKRMELFRQSPERYKELAEAWRAQAEQDLLERSGR